MEPFKAKIIEDSISETGIRITTFELRYPRLVHSEMMTHRQFSRNGRSSRAVPVKTLLAEEPYIPSFAHNKRGMQPGEQFTAEKQEEAVKIWLEAVRACKEAVEKLNNLGVHKQWANRPLEWFGFIDAVYTSVHWENFKTLRDHPAAQHEISIIASKIIEAFRNSSPKLLKSGEWHLPYVTLNEREAVKERSLIKPHDRALSSLLKLSAARCARVSYRPFDGRDSMEAEFDRFQRLVGDIPVHASPAEHQASPDFKHPNGMWANKKLHGNLTGYVQHRKLIPNNYIADSWE